MTFALDPRLTADTIPVADWTLCRVLLMNDRRFPWLILVPRRDGAVELHDLAQADRALLIEEMARAGRVLADLFAPGKINNAALGNAVRQLHVHVVARRGNDAAAGGLVWGIGGAEPYPADARAEMLGRLRTAFASTPVG